MEPLEALDWTDEQIREFAASATPAEIQQALTYWQTHAPAQYRTLLEAVEAEADDDTLEALAIVAGIWLWVEGRRQYRRRSGRLLTQAALRGVVDRVLRSARADIDTLSAQLIRREISLARWQTEMVSLLRQAHLSTGMAARGGLAQMSQADFAFVGGRFRQQLDFLRNFAREIESGTQRLNGNLLRRARMYGDAARGTHEGMRARMHISGGFTEGRRVLGVADHCEGNSDGCIEQAALGWQPIADVRPIGDSICRTNCHCHIEYRNSAGEVSR